MGCTDVTSAMLALLEALTVWPDVDTEDLRRRPEWAKARAWGWVMESGELTGFGRPMHTIAWWAPEGLMEN